MLNRQYTCDRTSHMCLYCPHVTVICVRLCIRRYRPRTVCGSAQLTADDACNILTRAVASLGRHVTYACDHYLRHCAGARRQHQQHAARLRPMAKARQHENLCLAASCHIQMLMGQCVQQLRTVGQSVHAHTTMQRSAQVMQAMLQPSPHTLDAVSHMGSLRMLHGLMVSP